MAMNTTYMIDYSFCGTKWGVGQFIPYEVHEFTKSV